MFTLHKLLSNPHIHTLIYTYTYTHIYRFFELDLDKDGKLGMEDLARYGDYCLSDAIVERYVYSVYIVLCIV